MEVVNIVTFVQAGIAAGSGLVGVGIGIGLFKTTIKRLSDDIESIKDRQSILRGEKDGISPIYMSRIDCVEKRSACGKTNKDSYDEICEDISEHTKAIRSLNNFARWWMQKEGLKIEDINRILDGGN